MDMEEIALHEKPWFKLARQSVCFGRDWRKKAPDANAGEREAVKTADYRSGNVQIY